MGNRDRFDSHSVFSSLRSSEINDSNLGDVLTAFTESFPFSKPNIAEGYLESRPSTNVFPGPPQDLKAPVVQPRFVALSWKPPIINSENIITYSVYYRQEDSER